MPEEINPTALKAKRRRRRAYFAAVVAFTVAYFVLLGGNWLVLRSPIFRIKEISIVGNNNEVASGAIMDLLDSRIVGGKFLHAILGFGNILIWPGGLSQSDLVFLPQIKSLSIEKDFEKRTVIVKVDERGPYGIWCLISQVGADNAASPSPAILASGSGNCFWFDKDGVIFKRAPAVQGSLINAVDDYSQKGLGLGSEILPERFLPNLFSVFGALRASGVGIKEIRLNDLSLEELEVLTYSSTSPGTRDGLPTNARAEAGPKLYFSLRFLATNAAAVMEDLMSKAGFKNLQYLDFRVENRIYYK